MKTWLRENRGFVLFLLGLVLMRTAVADWNPIPSGSMRPTLLEGDVVLVNRLAYDLKLPLTDVTLARLGEPARGDIVTFSSPADGTRLIKRIVGLPGDEVALRDGVLRINGKPVPLQDAHEVLEPLGDQGAGLPALRATEQLPDGRAHTVQHLPALAARRDFGPLVLGADEFFMLGDNRDNSADSRYIGPVPRHLLIARAHHVLVSAEITEHWAPRLARWGMALQ
jgi:signal peptidase I